MAELQRITHLEYNPARLALKIQELVLEGWELDEERPMTQLGYYWEVGFVRDPNAEQLAADAERLAKRSRAEILADARAAKAAKKAAQEAADNE